MYTPKDFDITRIMRDIVATGAAPAPGRRNGSALRQRLGVSGDGAALGARLRERDLSAAPAALNLLESTAAGRPRAGGARCCARSPPRRSAARRPRT